MPELPSTPIARYKFALKPASWPKLLVPMLLGQCLGAAASGSVSAAAIAFGLAFTVLDGVFIVLLNDWADRDIDALKRRMLPLAGSPKTIPDGVLPAISVLTYGAGAGVLATALSFAAGAWLERPLLGAAGLVCLAVFIAYSLPPLRLNYRGGGELLEALGVGLLLPWINAYAASGRVLGPELLPLSGYAVASLASAVASGLGDEVSDRAGGKRTVVTLLGNARARLSIERLTLAAAAVWGIASWLVPGLAAKASMVFAAAVVVAGYIRLRAVSAPATTYAFAEQGRYKLVLHRTIWVSGVVLAAFAALFSIAEPG